MNAKTIISRAKKLHNIKIEKIFEGLVISQKDLEALVRYAQVVGNQECYETFKKLTKK